MYRFPFPQELITEARKTRAEYDSPLGDKIRVMYRDLAGAERQDFIAHLPFWDQVALAGLFCRNIHQDAKKFWAKKKTIVPAALWRRDAQLAAEIVTGWTFSERYLEVTQQAVEAYLNDVDQDPVCDLHAQKWDTYSIEERHDIVVSKSATFLNILNERMGENQPMPEFLACVNNKGSLALHCVWPNGVHQIDVNYHQKGLALYDYLGAIAHELIHAMQDVRGARESIIPGQMTVRDREILQVAANIPEYGVYLGWGNYGDAHNRAQPVEVEAWMASYAFNELRRSKTGKPLPRPAKPLFIPKLRHGQEVRV